MGRKTFLSVNSWVGMKESKWWGLGVSSPSLPKSFLLKMEIKLKEEIGYHFWTKMPICNCTWASSTLLFFTLFFSFSFSFFLLDVACLLLFFFYFFIFYDLLGMLVQNFFFFFFGCCCCYLDVIFLWTWFLFFNKFRWLIFFFFLVIYHFFGFNWISFFHKGIYVNLYKITFSIIFPLPTK